MNAGFQIFDPPQPRSAGAALPVAGPAPGARSRPGGRLRARTLWRPRSAQVVPTPPGVRSTAGRSRAGGSGRGQRGTCG